MSCLLTKLGLSWFSYAAQDYMSRDGVAPHGHGHRELDLGKLSIESFSVDCILNQVDS